jgi:hypothetical protein
MERFHRSCNRESWHGKLGAVHCITESDTPIEPADEVVVLTHRSQLDELRSRWSSG